MAELNKLSPNALKAAVRGGTESWGQWASAAHHARYIEPLSPRSRLRCHCGCKQRATHSGKANGISLAHGCELSMRRWIKGLGWPIGSRHA